MGKVLGGLIVLLVVLMSPVVLVAAAFGGMASTTQTGSSSELIAEMQAAGYSNGRLPDVALTVVSERSGYRCRVALAGGAHLAWGSLVEAAARQGVVIEGGWCYRTFEEQAAAWNRRRCFIPGNCDGNPYPPTARPGTSVHGWGLAIDVWGASGLLGCASSEFFWLHAFAPRFGWIHPEWAACGDPGAEPWHWEYVGTGLTGSPTGGDT